MNMQLTFDLPRVDERATRAAVKKAFEQYHDYRKTLDCSAAPLHLVKGIKGPSANTTVARPDTDADLIRSSHHRTAYADMVEVAERLQQHQARTIAMMEYVEAVEQAVANLPEYEQAVMKATMMVDKRKRRKDTVIWPELGLCKNDYYECKEKAVLRIAFALRIEVYESKGDDAA